MKYDINKKDGGVFEVTVNLDAKEWEDILTQAYEKNKTKFSVPGFRKGHAPRNVVEKTYGAGVYLNDAFDIAYYNAYTSVLKEHPEISPIDAPSLDVKKFDDKGVEFVLNIQCVPEFELANVKGQTYTKKVKRITEKDIQEAIDRELLRSSRLVETKEPVKTNDFVTLDFDGYVDGKAFAGGKADNYQLQIGSHSFIDNFEDQLIGLNIGDKKDVEVTFPADYHEKSLAGKPATFKCEIKNIRARVLPELNEEFVTNSTEFDTVEAYKQGVKDRLKKAANDEADLELDNSMLDNVIDSTVLVVPSVLVDDEFDRQMNGMTQQMQYQGIKLEDYATYLGKTIDELKADIRKSSERNVKARLVLEKLIRDNGLDINQEDIDKRIEEMAKNVGKTVEEFRKQVNNDYINRIANELLMKRIINFLHENNEIK